MPQYTEKAPEQRLGDLMVQEFKESSVQSLVDHYTNQVETQVATHDKENTLHRIDAAKSLNKQKQDTTTAYAGKEDELDFQNCHIILFCISTQLQKIMRQAKKQ